MDPRRGGFASIVLIAIIVFAWIALSSANPQKNSPGSETAAVQLYHSVSGDTHSYRGSVPSEKGCPSYTTALRVSYGEPPHATITVSSEDTSMRTSCPSSMGRDIDVSFASSELPTVAVRVDGVERPVSIIEQ